MFFVNLLGEPPRSTEGALLSNTKSIKQSFGFEYDYELPVSLYS